jgi:hypothetical protein
MKSFIITSIFILLIVTTSIAQVKLIPGGSVSIGRSSSPSARLHVHGCSIFSDSSGAPSTAAYIRGLNTNSTDSTPDYTWLGNDRCGIFHPSSDNIGICMNGLEKFRVNASGITSYGSAFFYASTSSATSAPFIHGANSFSTVTRPDYSWYHDDNTGIFQPVLN